MWVAPAPDAPIGLTLVGSPNFGWRSATRDLEYQVAIAADDDVTEGTATDRGQGRQYQRTPQIIATFNGPREASNAKGKGADEIEQIKGVARQYLFQAVQHLI